MKRVLFITNIPSPYRIDFFNELGKKSDIDLIVVFLEKPYDHQDRSPDWFHEDYEYFTPIFLKKSIKISQSMFLCFDIITILKGKYDEIIFGGYNYPSMMHAMLYLKRKRIPYSIEIDGGIISSESYIKKAIKRFFISSASKWYSTGSVSDEYLIYYGAQANRIHHYPFSSFKQSDIEKEHITKQDYYKEKLNNRKKLSINYEYVVLAVGQFIKRKGFDTLLESATMLPHNVGIYIIGGVAPEEYKNYILQNDLKNVHIIGFLKKKYLKAYFLSSDVFVLPTREDIWGLVINEALAYGVPVITTNRCVAGLELIDDGKEGYIIDAEDPDLLANTILKVLSADLFEMRNNAINKASNYTIEKMASCHESIICHEK